jgi:hypothetical protein
MNPRAFMYDQNFKLVDRAMGLWCPKCHWPILLGAVEFWPSIAFLDQYPDVAFGVDPVCPTCNHILKFHNLFACEGEYLEELLENFDNYWG